MRIGAINDELSPNFKQALDLAVALGIQDIEIHTFNQKPIEVLKPDELLTLRKWLKERDLKVCNLSSTVFLRCHLDENCTDEIEWHTRFANISGGYADHLQALKRALEIAAELQAPSVRIFGFWKEASLTQTIFERAIERLREPLALAEAAEIPLLLENCPHTYFDWGARTIQLIEMAGSPWMRMLWDPCSGMRSGEPDVLEAYPRIRPWLAHVHAKDIRFHPTSKRGHSYVPIGEGEMRWPAILAQLASDDYEGVISLETHHQAPDGTKESAAIAMMAGMKQALSTIIQGEKL